MDNNGNGVSPDSGALQNHGILEGSYPPADLAFPGPSLPGFDAGNRAFYANNNGSVGLGAGSGELYAQEFMTVSFWAKQPDNVEGGDRIFTNNVQRLSGGSENSFQVVFGVGDGGGLVVATGQEADMQVHLPPPVYQTKNDEWHHIVVSRNGDNVNDILLVIDGVNYSGPTLVPTTATWGVEPPDARIASRNVAPRPQTLNGAVDEMAIWLDRSLTYDEALGLWNAAQTPVPEPSSVAVALLAAAGAAGAAYRRRSR